MNGPMSLFVYGPVDSEPHGVHYPGGAVSLAHVTGYDGPLVSENLERHIRVWQSGGTHTLIRDDIDRFIQAFIEYHELIVCAAPPDVKVLRAQIANLHATIEKLIAERNRLLDEQLDLKVRIAVANGMGIPQ